MNRLTQTAKQLIKFTPFFLISPNYLYCTNKKPVTLQGKFDTYGSIHLRNLQQYSQNPQEFQTLLENSIKIWKDNNVKAIWLKLDINELSLAQIVSDLGFQMHHCTQNYLLFSKWLLDEPSRLPHFTTHFIGVGGIVINENDEILLVQEKNGLKRGMWGIPGGLADDNELLTEAASREVFEETGLKTKGHDLLQIREAIQTSFGKSDLYFAFKMQVLENDLNVKLCKSELMEYKWVKISELDSFMQQNKMGPTQIQLMKELMKGKYNQKLVDIEQGKRLFYGQEKQFTVFTPVYKQEN